MRAILATVGFVLLLVACNKTDPASTSPTVPKTASAPDPSAAPTDAGSSAAPKTDPIDALVAKLSASPLWINGTFPKIELPRTATPAAVVAEVFTKISFEPGPVKTHTVLSTREVRIGEAKEPYLAVVVDTNLGKKIVLLQHQGDAGWWSRAFPYEP